VRPRASPLRRLKATLPGGARGAGAARSARRSARSAALRSTRFPAFNRPQPAGGVVIVYNKQQIYLLEDLQARPARTRVRLKKQSQQESKKRRSRAAAHFRSAAAGPPSQQPNPAAPENPKPTENRR